MIGLRPGTRPPRVIGHRGASSSFPENTAAAFDGALAEGCDAIELDVQLSRDHIPIVYRSQFLQRAGGGRRRTFQIDLADLKKLDVGIGFGARFRGQHILTLKQVLRKYASRTSLLLELKARPREKAGGWHRGLAEAVVDEIRSQGLRRSVMILSFDHETLRVVSYHDPVLRTAWTRRNSPSMRGADRNKIASVSALCIDVRVITPGIVRKVHRLRKPVIAYTCNTTRAARRALESGADAIMTNRPAWLRRTLRQQSGSRETGS